MTTTAADAGTEAERLDAPTAERLSENESILREIAWKLEEVSRGISPSAICCVLVYMYVCIKGCIHIYVFTASP